MKKVVTIESEVPIDNVWLVKQIAILIRGTGVKVKVSIKDENKSYGEQEHLAHPV